MASVKKTDGRFFHAFATAESSTSHRIFPCSSETSTTLHPSSSIFPATAEEWPCSGIVLHHTSTFSK